MRDEGKEWPSGKMCLNQCNRTCSQISRLYSPHYTRLLDCSRLICSYVFSSIILNPTYLDLSSSASVFLFSYTYYLFFPCPSPPLFFFFFFNDPAPPEISPFPLHDPLPIFPVGRRWPSWGAGPHGESTCGGGPVGGAPHRSGRLGPRRCRTPLAAQPLSPTQPVPTH